MRKLFSIIRKELLILVRDRSGMALLFLMPSALVTLMALIQDAPFRDYQEVRIPALIINHDSGKTGSSIVDGLKSSRFFEIDSSKIPEEQLRDKVSKGHYEVGIYIPEQTSRRLKSMVQFYTDDILHGMGLADSVRADTIIDPAFSEIRVYFAPDIKKSFRNSVMNGILRVNASLESEALLGAFREQLSKDETDTTLREAPFGSMVSVRESSTGDTFQMERELNSVQHNVPAWTMFGMFFIVITLAGNMIREREEGSYVRILTMPVHPALILTGKMVAYTFICLAQCLLMFSVGLFLLPLTGLPALIIGQAWFSVLIVSISCSLAAVGFGLFAGTIFKTHQQSSTFGAVSVVILAALGGIWVPVYVMPEALQLLAGASPLHWGLSAFQHAFLGDGSIKPLLGDVSKLLLFFAATLFTSVFISKYLRST
jgi:ABC-2 type transport system permease protein